VSGRSLRRLYSFSLSSRWRTREKRGCQRQRKSCLPALPEGATKLPWLNCHSSRGRKHLTDHFQNRIRSHRSRGKSFWQVSYQKTEHDPYPPSFGVNDWRWIAMGTMSMKSGLVSSFPECCFTFSRLDGADMMTMNCQGNGLCGFEGNPTLSATSHIHRRLALSKLYLFLEVKQLARLHPFESSPRFGLLCA
jgi:hypothetical protein